MDTVLYMKALRALSERWVHQETKMSIWDSKKVIVSNPNFPPMIYEKGRWRRIKHREGRAS